MHCDSIEVVELFTNRCIFVILETFRSDICLDTQSNDGSHSWNVINFDYSKRVQVFAYTGCLNSCFFLLSFPQFVSEIVLLIPAPTFTFAPCMLLCLFYSKPTHALLFNTHLEH
jgi:hypothetical protein